MNKKSKNVGAAEPTVALPVLPAEQPVAPAAAPAAAPQTNYQPALQALLSGGDNLGNGFGACLFLMCSVNGQPVNLVELFDQHRIPTHIRNRIVTILRANKRFNVSYSSPLTLRLK